MIDLRSDTCSTPTDEMRAAIAAAEVGDDVYHDDPSVHALEAYVADLLGKEDAVFMVTGTMTNQVALRTHTEAGDQIVTEATAHVHLLESGAPAALSGLTVRPIVGTHGIFTAAQVEAVVPRPHRFMPSTVIPPVKLLCVENTHNMAGGTVWTLEQISAVAATARARGLATHLDGARLWHAVVETGTTAAEYASHFDSVSVCFSKGLGAPVGSALAGRTTFIARARRFKQAFGGGFRQAGIVAAGALHAVTHHRERLVDDHANAKRFAQGLADIPGLSVDLDTVQTNIVRFRVTAISAADFVERCHAEGLYVLTGGSDQVRAVMYLNITRDDVEQALRIARRALG